VTDRALQSLAIVEQRIETIALHVDALVGGRARLPAIERGPGTVVSGIGASSGPARHLAQLLGARFAPLSSFTSREPPRGDVLVVFSQHLSPNARLALARTKAYRRAVLFTSTPEASFPPGVEVVRLPPDDERGTYLRVVGPHLALVAATLVAQPGEPLAGISALVARALGAISPLVPFDRPLALVTAGEDVAGYRTIAWKLLEGWGVAEPPVWDVVEIVHGPLQQFHDAPLTVVSLEAAGDAELFDRLDRVLVPGRHLHVRVRSELCRSLALIEHDAKTTALLLAGLRARPRDLFVPEAPVDDAPLYQLGA
jgi:hypothetical protein